MVAVDDTPSRPSGQFSSVMLTIGVLLGLLVLANVFWPAYFLIPLAVFTILWKPVNRERAFEFIEDTFGLEPDTELKKSHLNRLFWPALFGIVGLRILFALLPDATLILSVVAFHIIFVLIQGKLQLPVVLDFLLFGVVFLAMDRALLPALALAIIVGFTWIAVKGDLEKQLAALAFQVVTAFFVYWLAAALSALTAAIVGMLLAVVVVAIFPIFVLGIGSPRTLLAFVVKVSFTIALLMLL